MTARPPVPEPVREAAKPYLTAWGELLIELDRARLPGPIAFCMRRVERWTRWLAGRPMRGWWR